MSDVTRIASAIEEGGVRAADHLLSAACAGLHRLTISRMAHERPGQFLHITALVREAWLLNPIRQDGKQPS